MSRAVASSPAGPFLDDSSAPLVCQRDHGGSIDASPFVDADGRAFLLWKSEGFGAAPATLWSQELTADRLALTGAPRPGLRRRQLGLGELHDRLRDLRRPRRTVHQARRRPRAHLGRADQPNVGYPSSRYLHIGRVRVTDGRITIDTSG